jgi:hypothetical protein
MSRYYAAWTILPLSKWEVKPPVPGSSAQETLEAMNERDLADHSWDDPAKAERLYLAALNKHPSDAQTHANYSSFLVTHHRYDEAYAHLSAIIDVQPGFAETMTRMGICHLSVGDYEKGWPLYERRYVNAFGFTPPVDLRQRLWAGQRAKTVILLSEGGFGDMIQAARYLPLVAERVEEIYIALKPPLTALFKHSFPFVHVIDHWQEDPPDALYCPMMSLPMRFNTTLDNLPVAPRYLRPEPKLVELWQDRLAPLTGRKIGLVWAGDVKHTADQHRSIAPDMLNRLSSVSGVNFIGMRQGNHSEFSGLPSGLPLYNLSALINDFSDLAALIEVLDLVITVDSAPLHVAGALNKPAWLLNRYNTEWRWLTERSDSPWYPSIRIFRQPALGDWSSVLDAVIDALNWSR